MYINKMNTTDYLVQSDILAGVISALISKMSCKATTQNLWKPAVESIVMSILGRMWENNLTGKTFSREPESGKPIGIPYIRSEEGRSSLIIYITSVLYAYISKKGNAYESATMNVASDVLGSQLQAALFENDNVWYAKAK
jgi:hypothetical protein